MSTSWYEYFLPLVLSRLAWHCRSLPGTVYVVVDTDRNEAHTGGIQGSRHSVINRLKPDTPVPVGSLSKSMLAVGIHRLVDQGTLSLEDYITNCLPKKDLASIPESIRERLENIKIKHLLTHSSTLSSDAGFPILPDHTITFDDMKGENIDEVFFDFSPGEVINYSRWSFYLLEKLLPENRAEFLRTEIFEPLGMHHAVVSEGGRNFPRGIQRGFGPRNEAAVKYSRVSLVDHVVRAFGASTDIVAPPQEMAFYADFLIRGNSSVLSEFQRRKVLEEFIRQGNASYTLGSLVSYGDGVVGHLGVPMGWSNLLLADTKNGNAVYVVSKTTELPSHVFSVIKTSLSMLSEAKAMSNEEPDPRIARLGGVYRSHLGTSALVPYKDSLVKVDFDNPSALSKCAKFKFSDHQTLVLVKSHNDYFAPGAKVTVESASNRPVLHAEGLFGQLVFQRPLRQLPRVYSQRTFSLMPDCNMAAAKAPRDVRVTRTHMKNRKIRS